VLATRRLVFSCRSPGLVTFSDRPCGPWTEIREVRLDPAPAVPKQTAAPTAAAASRDTASPGANAPPVPNEPAATAADVQARTCERLRRAVDTLDDRMRAGYSAREAGRLWARWREARERLREADC
jgi:hypothetical protein